MSWYHHLLDFLSFSRYALVFIGCIVEGPIVMITSGFLLRAAQFQLVPLYFSLMAGDFVADLGWYAVGRFGARSLINRFGHHLGITPQIIAKIQKRFHTYQDKILFISKITMGFGFALATLIVAGMLHVPFKRYVILNFFGGFIWTAFLLTVGYFFAHIYFMLIGPLKIAFIVVLIILVVYGLWAANRYLAKAEI
ncbi:MAG: DedA family protein [Patescibacteria group bacterium]|nr:DedA family protein [Patescibacteria group bacterium]